MTLEKNRDTHLFAAIIKVLDDRTTPIKSLIISLFIAYHLTLLTSISFLGNV